MKRDSFVFYASDYQSIKDMTNAQLGTFFRAICEFALYGSTKMEDKELKYAFNLLTDKIKRDQAKYDEVSKKRSEIAKKARSKQLLAIAADSNRDSNNECESEIINIKKYFLFEKRVCPVNAEFDRFWHHYSKNDWVAGNGVKITNKMACAQNWKIPESVQTMLSSHAAAWKKVYERLEKEADSYLLITDLQKMCINDSQLSLFCTEAMCVFLEKYIADIRNIIITDFACNDVTYTFPKNSNNEK